jgi:hypothetical protein
MAKATEIRKLSLTTAFHNSLTKYLVGDIVIGEYSPRRPMSDRYNAANLKRRLEQWEAQLPECMKKAPPDETLGAAFWASQLHMAYQ